MIGGLVKENDRVRTSDSVKTLTVSSIEELDTRSMRWSARPYDILAPVGSHVQDTDFSRGVDAEQAVMGNARAWHAGLRTSRIRARTEHAASLI